MDAEMKIEACDYIATGIEKSQSGGKLDQEAGCKFVKDAMDRQYGPSWHCVMGEGYSFDVTRQ
jgi:dynein light chain 4